MEHIFRWFLPTSIRSEKKYFEFDITKYCKTFFSNDLYFEREIHFNKSYKFDRLLTEKFSNITIKIYPFTSAPMSNTNEAESIVENEIGAFEDYQHIVSRGNLRKMQGLIIVQMSLNADISYSPNLKLEEEYDIEKIFGWNDEFENLKSAIVSVANDICAFFLLGLHLTYPTHSTYHESTPPQSSGLLSFTHEGGRYIMDEHSDIMSYPILLEEERLNILATNLGLIAQVWHKNIWSFHRFLKAVQSNYITIDSFLDLVFALESFFDKNTSTEMMRLVTSIIIANNRQDTQKIDQLLLNSFRIRNEVAHGGLHYRLYDYMPGKTKGKKKMILESFWELKNLNIALISYGIRKLIADKSPFPPSSIRFGVNDILNKLF